MEKSSKEVIIKTMIGGCMLLLAFSICWIIATPLLAIYTGPSVTGWTLAGLFIAFCVVGACSLAGVMALLDEIDKR